MFTVLFGLLWVRLQYLLHILLECRTKQKTNSVPLTSICNNAIELNCISYLKSLLPLVFKIKHKVSFCFFFFLKDFVLKRLNKATDNVASAGFSSIFDHSSYKVSFIRRSDKNYTIWNNWNWFSPGPPFIYFLFCCTLLEDIFNSVILQS